ncbi:hypothetical protein DSO57_1006967 [Entomophthora muscae]|uniref:Uncharacterized protein n=1 Tax=Entomophthora muscae TaxID=34485 RepID=A0ACC2TIH7_9FUNG|nr:hypothetical protein DSO57_1006967 [Entomophthora muscae]
MDLRSGQWGMATKLNVTPQLLANDPSKIWDNAQFNPQLAYNFKPRRIKNSPGPWIYSPPAEIGRVSLPYRYIQKQTANPA